MGEFEMYKAFAFGTPFFAIIAIQSMWWYAWLHYAIGLMCIFYWVDIKRGGGGE